MKKISGLILVMGVLVLAASSCSSVPEEQETSIAPNPVPKPQPTFSLPTSVPSGTQVRIDGSTSMVIINQKLKAAFEKQFPGTSLNPDAPNYPYQRALYYVYKQPASATVQAFLGYATSPEGQKVILGGN